jgi:hypothetical protein
MTIAQIIEMLKRRLVNLSQLRTSAADLGDLDRVSIIDAEIAETQNTLAALETL